LVFYIQTINLFRGSSGPEEIELDKDTADVINRINPAQHIQTNNKGKVHFNNFVVFIFCTMSELKLVQSYSNSILKTSIIVDNCHLLLSFLSFLEKTVEKKRRDRTIVASLGFYPLFTIIMNFK
jgi:hypothetical protein